VRAAPGGPCYEPRIRLRELPVLCVDCQATGATPALGALLELGWAVVGAEERAVSAHWIELPPGERVSRIVRELTGYEERHRSEAIPVGDAWRRMRDDAAPLSLGGGRVPTVIHFARFELAFLRDVHERLVPEEPFPLDAICLHEIARRLFPDLPRRSLRALAGYLGHSPELVRRSGGHVDATAFAWRALAPRLEAEGVGSWDELRAFLEAPAPKRSKKRAYPIAPETRRALPDVPGVYRFVRSNGDVLYVGKAASIKKRVSSHFGAGGKATERGLEMLTQAHDIDVTPTSTALEAALLETDEIKRLDPPYNVHLKEGGRRAWFVGRDLVSADEVPSADRPIGPLPSRFALRALGAILDLASGREPDKRLRAAAVGVPDAFAPEPEVFAPAWASFADAHLRLGRTPWGKLVRGAAALRLVPEVESEDAPEGWDAPRVKRHLERSLRGGGQLVRRARIMTILSCSSVAFRERGRTQARLLSFAGCEIAERRDLAERAVAQPADEAHRWRERQSRFDAASYDRLRVLVTELLRVLAEGGEVAIGVRGRVLDGERAARLLRAV
jgi:DNA polymerase-3 subunit epsilon